MVTQPAPVQKAAVIRPVPTIRFDGGSVAGVALRIDEEDGTLGRSQDSTYVLADPTVSRVHARLQKRAGSVILTDLSSSGGTTVNGETVTGAHVLVHGDTIGFGSVTGRFEDPATARDEQATTTVFEVPEIETGPSLSPRQQQVLELIAEGMTNKEIGEQLGITERTVKVYAQEVYGKLDTPNRAGAVAEGVRHGLL